MFSIDPYTFTGLLADLKLNKNWTLQGGLHAGNDMAPWTSSSQLNGHFTFRWVSDSGNDSIYAGVNSIGAGHYRDGHDNLQQVIGTWSHKFSDKIQMATEAYYMWQFDALKGGSVNYGPIREFGGGGPGLYVPGRSDSIGLVNYFQIQLSAKDYLSIRNDFLADPQGQRTGFVNNYSSHTLGWVHQFTKWVAIRPEIKYERGYSNAAYDLGTHDEQWKFGIDLIVRF
jgi:hypothetical protein